MIPRLLRVGAIPAYLQRCRVYESVGLRQFLTVIFLTCEMVICKKMSSLESFIVGAFYCAFKVVPTDPHPFLLFKIEIGIQSAVKVPISVGVPVSTSRINS